MFAHFMESDAITAYFPLFYRVELNLTKTVYLVLSSVSLQASIHNIDLNYPDQNGCFNY